MFYPETLQPPPPSTASWVRQLTRRIKAIFHLLISNVPSFRNLADYDAEWAQELEVLESILTPEELESQFVKPEHMSSCTN